MAIQSQVPCMPPAAAPQKRGPHDHVARPQPATRPASCSETSACHASQLATPDSKPCRRTGVAQRRQRAAPSAPSQTTGSASCRAPPSTSTKKRPSFPRSGPPSQEAALLPKKRPSFPDFRHQVCNRMRFQYQRCLLKPMSALSYQQSTQHALNV